MAKKIDFLRHIVNRTLIEEKISPQIVDEIRKQVANAEDKYGFSAFGGNPEKLVDYLKSKDFDILISVFKAGDALPVLVKILEKTKNYYSEYSELVNAINEKIANIKSKEKNTQSRES